MTHNVPGIAFSANGDLVQGQTQRFDANGIS
jgi:hypothetical protein